MSQFNRRVYLAGPISGLDYKGCTGWREYAVRELADSAIEGVSPMRAKAFLRKVVGPLSGTGEGYPEHPFATSRGVMTRDRFDATTCGVILVNLLGATKVSIGTVMEIAWADLLRTTIVAVMEPGNLHEHLMVNEAIGFKTDDLDEALYMVKRILK